MMSFRVNDKKMLKKYDKRCDTIVDNEKYIKTKIRMYEDRVINNFQDKKIPKENASYNCIALVSVDCVIRINKKYYPQAYLCECKYQERKNKIENMTDDDLASDSEADSELIYESCREE